MEKFNNFSGGIILLARIWKLLILITDKLAYFSHNSFGKFALHIQHLIVRYMAFCSIYILFFFCLPYLGKLWSVLPLLMMSVLFVWNLGIVTFFFKLRNERNAVYEGIYQPDEQTFKFYSLDNEKVYQVPLILIVNVVQIVIMAWTYREISRLFPESFQGLPVASWLFWFSFTLEQLLRAVDFVDILDIFAISWHPAPSTPYYLLSIITLVFRLVLMVVVFSIDFAISSYRYAHA